MAPLTVELISESLSQKENEPFCLRECLSRARIGAVGVFVMGFSAGSAIQVHFRPYIPRPLRALLLLPIVSGVFGAYKAHDFFRDRCIRQWILSDQTPFNPNCNRCNKQK